ncbi:MAG: LacI family transcriptional regulator [Chloroflexi bacterium]|nr:LacI family transcriptional regulator [Chloroflexota bacterium]
MRPRRGRGVTILDVAERAGVSVSTASRALTGHPDVSAQTRKQVLGASQELGYRPSLLAQSLVLGRTSTIGLLVSDIANPFYPALAKSIEDAASNFGYIVVLCNTDDDPPRSLKYLDRLIAQGVDGIIHASVGEDEKHLSLASQAGVPVVVLNRRPRLLRDVDVVISDNQKGAEEIVTHLLELGHRTIGHIAGPEYATLCEDRLAGYRRALEKKGIPFNPELVVRSKFTHEAGAQAVQELLQREPRTTAIFAVNDVVALGAMDALLERGLEIPRQISLVGFDDIEISRSPTVQLTTVRQNLVEMGRLGVMQLVDAMSNPETHQPQRIVLEAGVVLRNTAAQPADIPQPE